MDSTKELTYYWSLDACHGFALKNKIFPEQDMVCVKTLYNYVDSALLKVRSIELPLKVRFKAASFRSTSCGG